MSQKFQAKLPCPECKNYFEATLYRSIWGEYPENRAMVFNDTIISPICPHCGVRAKISNATLLYHDGKAKFAVWYEPEYDNGIDKDKEGYSRMFGPQNYLAQAPRIKSWSEFKETIKKFESGKLKTNVGEISPELKQQVEGFLNQMNSQSIKSKNSGCFVLVTLTIVLFSSLYLLFNA